MLIVRVNDTLVTRLLIQCCLIHPLFARVGCGLLLSLTSACLFAQPSQIALPQAALDDPLVKIVQLRPKPVPLVFDFTIDSYTTSSVPELGVGPIAFPKKPRFQMEGHVRIKGSLIDIRKREIAWINSKRIIGNETRQMYDGKRFWNTQFPPSPNLWCPVLSIDQDTTRPEIAKAIADVGGVLEGSFPFFPNGDWLYLALISPTTHVEEREEKINNFPCRMVRFRVGRNGFTFWVDMKHGGLPRQIEIILPEAPLSFWKQHFTFRKPGEVELRVYEIRDIEIAKVGDREMPVAGMFVTRTFYRNGNSDCRVDRIHRSRILLDPPDLGKFDIGMPEGTVVDVAKGALKYEWCGGELKPFLDPAVVAGIGETVRQIVHEVSRLPAPLLRGFRLSKLESNSSSTLAVRNHNTLDRHCYEAFGPRDGLYCLYAAFRLGGINVEPEALFRPEYLDKAEGSSLDQLAAAARKQGLIATTATALSARMLAASPYPILLRVKGQTYSKDYDSWELFLGPKDGQAWIWDPGQSPRLEPFVKVASRWNGTGLILSSVPAKLYKLRMPDILLAVLTSITLLFLMWRIRLFVRDRGTARRPAPGFFHFVRYSIMEGICVAALALLVGLFWHAFTGGGLLTANGAKNISLSRKGVFIPSLDINRVRRIVEGHESAILIDARSPFAYYLNHIPNAKNVPLESTDQDIRASLAGLHRDSRMVIYCASETCHMAESLAARMAAEGFTHLEIYKGGWAEWMESEEKSRI